MEDLDKELTPAEKKALTEKVNPYQIEDFMLRAKALISSIEDNKVESETKLYFDILINNVYKKWHYAYNIQDLQNKSSKYMEKEIGSKMIDTSTTAYIQRVFPTSNKIVKPYHDNNRITDHSLVVFDKNIYLLKKARVLNNCSIFEVIAKLKIVNINNNYTIRIDDTYYNNENKFNIEVNDNINISLYKKPGNYPLFIIIGEYFISTTNLVNIKKVKIPDASMFLYTINTKHYKIITENITKSRIPDNILTTSDIENIVNIVQKY